VGASNKVREIRKGALKRRELAKGSKVLKWAA
jgi:hypothetical protein